MTIYVNFQINQKKKTENTVPNKPKFIKFTLILVQIAQRHNTYNLTYFIIFNIGAKIVFIQLQIEQNDELYKCFTQINRLNYVE